jgi:hypothetical protein
MRPRFRTNNTRPLSSQVTSEVRSRWAPPEIAISNNIETRQSQPSIRKHEIVVTHGAQPPVEVKISPGWGGWAADAQRVRRFT